MDLHQPDERLNELRERLAELPAPLAFLESFFALGPIPLLVFRADGHPLLANQAFRDMFQSEPPPEYSVLEDELVERDGLRDLIHRAFAGETVRTPPIWYDPRELRQVSVPDARRAAFVVTAFPLRDPAGAVTHVAMVYQDMTRELEAREEAEARRAQAEEANRAKDAFLAMLGHELRNPLAPIVTALEVMRRSGERAFERERGIIERQVVHLTRLVDDLLDVSRITRGTVELAREPVPLERVIAGAVETIGPLVAARGQRLEVSVEPSSDLAPGLVVLGDERRLMQVVANLLSNATRYTPERGRIEVRAWREPEAVLVAVRDTGAGIAPELLARVFDPFVQGRRSLDRHEGGLGLGLAIVRSFVEAHGGSVRASSQGPGRGSEFVVRLPPAPSVAPARAVEPAAPAPPAPRARLLVVDDNRDAADGLAEALRLDGHEVAVAYDGPTALGLAARDAPAAALLDLGLPGMDGFELARRLRALDAPPRLVVAVTGYGQTSDRARSAAAGFDEHLVKPVAPGEVTALLARRLTALVE